MPYSVWLSSWSIDSLSSWWLHGVEGTCEVCFIVAVIKHLTKSTSAHGFRARGKVCFCPWIQSYCLSQCWGGAGTAAQSWGQEAERGCGDGVRPQGLPAFSFPALVYPRSRLLAGKRGIFPSRQSSLERRPHLGVLS